jgi:hypothetical protein
MPPISERLRGFDAVPVLMMLAGVLLVVCIALLF